MEVAVLSLRWLDVSKTLDRVSGEGFFLSPAYCFRAHAIMPRGAGAAVADDLAGVVTVWRPV